MICLALRCARSLSGIVAAKNLVDHGEAEGRALVNSVIDRIKPVSEAQIEYVEWVDPRSVNPISHIAGPRLLTIAVRVAKTWVLDNIILPCLASSAIRD